LSEGLRSYSRAHREGLFSAISAGFFLILIGMIFVITPNLFDKTITFFSNFDVTTPVSDTGIYLPAPDPLREATNSTVRDANLGVYTAVQRFSLVWGIFLIAILVARFVYNSPRRKRAENISDIVFSLGAFYFIQALLIDTNQWFVFWSAIIVLAGVSLIVRAIFLAIVRE
jgi:hypothetical protein